MELLREKIELAIVANCDTQPMHSLRAAADAILSIPEIESGIALYLASIEERDPD